MDGLRKLGEGVSEECLAVADFGDFDGVVDVCGTVSLGWWRVVEEWRYVYIFGGGRYVYIWGGEWRYIYILGDGLPETTPHPSGSANAVHIWECPPFAASTASDRTTCPSTYPLPGKTISSTDTPPVFDGPNVSVPVSANATSTIFAASIIFRNGATLSAMRCSAAGSALSPARPSFSAMSATTRATSRPEFCVK